MSARISARLDDATQHKLESLRAETHKSVTELISEALNLYYQRYRHQLQTDNYHVAGDDGDICRC